MLYTIKKKEVQLRNLSKYLYSFITSGFHMVQHDTCESLAATLKDDTSKISPAQIQRDNTVGNTALGA